MPQRCVIAGEKNTVLRETDSHRSLRVLLVLSSHGFCLPLSPPPSPPASARVPLSRFSFGREVRRVQALYYCAADRARRSRRTCPPRSPVLQPLPIRAATPARGRRGIDIYEVRWLVTSLYTTFGRAGARVAFRLGIFPRTDLRRRCSSSREILPGELEGARHHLHSSLQLSLSSIDLSIRWRRM